MTFDAAKRHLMLFLQVCARTEAGPHLYLS